MFVYKGASNFFSEQGLIKIFYFYRKRLKKIDKPFLGKCIIIRVLCQQLMLLSNVISKMATTIFNVYNSWSCFYCKYKLQYIIKFKINIINKTNLQNKYIYRP